jgi:hypothetical protein
MAFSVQARSFVAAIVIIGIVAMLAGAAQWQTGDLAKFLSYLSVALVASFLKVKRPGITSTMSVNFLFVLVGVVEPSMPQTLVIGCSATLIQGLARTTSRPKLIQPIFNICAVSIAVALAARVYNIAPLRGMDLRDPLLMAVVAQRAILVPAPGRRARSFQAFPNFGRRAGLRFGRIQTDQ